MKIAVIDNYDSFVFNLVRYIDEIDSTDVEVFRNDKIDFDYVDECDAILLSPGPGVPKEAGDLMKVIDLHHANKPILGVCLGHQALAEYFGGSIQQNEKPLHGKASTIKKIEENSILKELPNKFQVGRYHSWSVNPQLPKNLTITAITDEEEIMAMQHVSLPISGVQFHPESILTPKGRQIISNWVESI